MEREVNEEKRKKFIENAGKRVNNVLHGIQILEPMARSNVYDFTEKDVEEMFNAMQTSLNEARGEYERRFKEKGKSEKALFSFSTDIADSAVETINTVVTESEDVTLETNTVESSDADNVTKFTS